MAEQLQSCRSVLYKYIPHCLYRAYLFLDMYMQCMKNSTPHMYISNAATCIWCMPPLYMYVGLFLPPAFISKLTLFMRAQLSVYDEHG